MIFLSILMAGVICVHFSQLVDPSVTLAAFHNTSEHTHVKMLVSTLAHQVPWVDTDGEVVNEQWNQAYASQQGKWHYYACDTKCHKWFSTQV